MKLLLIFLSIPALMALNNTGARKISIEEAMKEQLISAKATSNGKYNQESVKMVLSNKSASKLIVVIPAGFSFYPSDDGEQTLVTTEEQFLDLEPKSTTTKLLKAYCSEASDGAPTEFSTFTFGKTKLPTLQKLANYTSTHNVSPTALQDAVWAVSSDRSISNIVAETPEDKALRTFISELTGKKDAWYTSPQNYELNESRNIVSETVKIQGDLKFSLAETTTFYQEIRKKDGEVMMKGQKMLTLQKGENIKFHFRIEVTGWEKGEYDVFVISTKNKIVTQYEFAV